MKKIKSMFYITVALVVGLSSCLKIEEPAGTNESSVNLLITQGIWRISLFSERGTDETAKFVDYEFIFTSNGTVSAARDNSLINGTWNEGIINNIYMFGLNFGTVAPFDELNDYWNLIELTAGRIRFQHLNGEHNDIDTLTFEKK